MIQFLQSAEKPAAMLRRAALVLIAAGTIPMCLVGCFGQFPLTSKVYQINKEVSSSKWIRTLVMWVFAIFPVYGLAIFIDVIALNLIEFWSGKPVYISQTVEQPDGSVITMQTSEDGNTLVMTVSKDAETIAERHFVRLGDGTTEVRDEQMEAIAVVNPDGEGGFIMTQLSTGATQQISSLDIAELRAQQVL